MPRVVAAFDDFSLKVSPASANDRDIIQPPRRQSTQSRFARLTPAKQKLAFEFRALPRPCGRYSLLATLASCTLLVLIVGAPYATNERAHYDSPALRTALRGLIPGALAYFVIGPIFLVNAPMLKPVVRWLYSGNACWRNNSNTSVASCPCSAVTPSSALLGTRPTRGST